MGSMLINLCNLLPEIFSYLKQLKCKGVMMLYEYIM